MVRFVKLLGLASMNRCKNYQVTNDVVIIWLLDIYVVGYRTYDEPTEVN
jgi:hypothetical protein